MIFPQVSSGNLRLLNLLSSKFLGNGMCADSTTGKNLEHGLGKRAV
jgi:hypothetical protein